LVNVPSPERYAAHKLIVSVLRRAAGPSAIKSDKDIVQASLLMEALIMQRREDDLAAALSEAADRGASWRQHLISASANLSDQLREFVLSIVRETDGSAAH